MFLRDFSIFYIVGEHKIDNPEAAHEFFYCCMQKNCFAIFEDYLRLIKNVVDLWEYFFDLMHSMFFLNVIKCTFDIHYL